MIASTLARPLARTFPPLGFTSTGVASPHETVGAGSLAWVKVGGAMVLLVGSASFSPSYSFEGTKPIQALYALPTSSALDDKSSLVGASETRSVAEQIQWLRKALGVNMSDLAQLLEVTRPAVYGWLKGVVPQSDTVTRLSKLVGQVGQIAALGLERPDLLLKRPIFAGQSPFELLKSGIPLSVGQLSAMQELDASETKVRMQTKVLGNTHRGSEEIVSDSVPLMST